MIELKKKPFCLNDAAIEWIEQVKYKMSLDEKIGQLFVPIGYSGDHKYLDDVMLRHHIGGIMYRQGRAEDVQNTFRYLQCHSPVPLLIGANLEMGGNGIATDGTIFGRQMQIAATGNTEQAYRLGKVSCAEAKAVGCNWSFAPVVDIDLNYHNPITNVRTYGQDPNQVLQYALAYKRGADEEGFAVAIKHFPGDGVDEVDQHILVSVNSLTCEEWDATYGKVYQGLIDDGAMTCMVGHIAQPAYQEAIDGKKEQALIPATLSPALLSGLLRKKLGFNGLIITDSTCMVGFNVLMPRSQSVPYAIEAGCDMFLFNKDLEEDFQYMKGGYYVKGVVTGDFGTSYTTHEPVLKEILERFPTSIKVCFGAVFIGLVLGVPLGIISALKQYSWLDSIVLVLSMIANATPGFCLAFVLITIFSLNLGWLPAVGLQSWKGYILPMATIGLASLANYTRITRSSMLEVIRQDYIRTARAKGQNEFNITWSHALRNAAVPIVASVGQQVGHQLGGALIVETVFGLPGLGKYIGDAVGLRNWPALQGGVLFLALVFTLVNLATDIGFTLVNPRLKSSIMNSKETKLEKWLAGKKANQQKILLSKREGG